MLSKYNFKNTASGAVVFHLNTGMVLIQHLFYYIQAQAGSLGIAGFLAANTVKTVKNTGFFVIGYADALVGYFQVYLIIF